MMGSLSLAPQMIAASPLACPYFPSDCNQCHLYDACTTRVFNCAARVFAEIVSKTMIVALSMPPHA